MERTSHAVGLGTELELKFLPKYFFARLVFNFGGMPELSNLWTTVHFFNPARPQNIILQWYCPFDHRTMPLMAKQHHYYPYFAKATLLAAWHRFVSFDWLKWWKKRTISAGCRHWMDIRGHWNGSWRKRFEPFDGRQQRSDDVDA